MIRSGANVKIATTDFIFSFELLVFVAQYGQLLVLSTCKFKCSYVIYSRQVDYFSQVFMG